jgi:putative transcriptional regulator
MRKSIANSIMSLTEDLHNSGVFDETTVQSMEKLCLPEVKDYSSRDIVRLRKTYKLTQSAFASVINVSASTVKQWERGAKKPAGASKKLLSIIENKGIEALI